MTVQMSGINMYSMALVMKVVLGWDIHFSIWVSSLTVAVYVFLGGLLSAIFNEVLQFVLFWLGALLIPILGLMEAGGCNGMVHRTRRCGNRELAVPEEEAQGFAVNLVSRASECLFESAGDGEGNVLRQGCAT